MWMMNWKMHDLDDLGDLQKEKKMKHWIVKGEAKLEHSFKN